MTSKRQALVAWVITGLALLGLVMPPLLAQTNVANSAADLAGKFLMVADSTTGRTVTNLFTFNRGAAAPFAVAAGATKVANLDADKLDGIDSTAFISTPVAADLTFTDATYDIGKTGATRPRDFFLSRNATVGGTLNVVGVVTAPGVPVLLKANSGTDSTVGAANVDTIAITGLTALDTLVVEYSLRSSTGTTTVPNLRNSTDTVTVSNLLVAGASLGVGEKLIGTVKIRQLQNSNVNIFAQSMTSVVATGSLGGDAFNPTFSTAWTGSWSLALRHGGVSAGAFQWSWAVYKLPGQ